MNYYVYHFSLSPVETLREVLIAFLDDLPFESFQDTETGLDAFLPDSLDDEPAIEALMHQLSNLGAVSYQKEFIAEQNWNATWEREYPTVEVETKCLVRAPFHPADHRFELDILIQPKMSFGTGHHATTYLMLRKLFDLDVAGKKVLDMGSGTGVLAIAAKKRGAADVLAVDIESWAYHNTIENIGLNDVNIRVEKGDVGAVKGDVFDLILANINKNVLMADMALYAKALIHEGHLVLSGFFGVDINEIQEAAERNGLILADSNIREGWAALHFRKK
jgi:ribosomal protein L11 methyltransferase